MRIHIPFHALRPDAPICCDGSVEALLCQLIRSEKLSEEDLIELKRIAGRKKSIGRSDKTGEKAMNLPEFLGARFCEFFRNAGLGSFTFKGHADSNALRG